MRRVYIKSRHKRPLIFPLRIALKRPCRQIRPPVDNGSPGIRWRASRLSWVATEGGWGLMLLEIRAHHALGARAVFYVEGRGQAGSCCSVSEALYL